MGFNIGKIASIASSIASKADIGSLASGFNLDSLNASNIDSIKGTIESTLNSKMSSITSELQSSIGVSDIESMASGFDFEAQANQLQSSLTSGTLDESQIQSQVDSMMSNMDSSLSQINFMM